MINKLYISSIDYNWSTVDSVLLTQHNIDSIILSPDSIDCHTSVEDLFCENISLACNNANEIILVNIDRARITNNNCFSYGRLFNEIARHPNKTNNFAWKKNFNFLIQERTTEHPLLWTAGCSVTAGAAIEHKDRWGSLLSNYLNLPELTLAMGGSSISWSADQLLRSDIRPGDTVVWGLTNLARTEISVDWNFKPLTVGGYSQIEKKNQYWTLDYFESETQVLTSIRKILQVVNFCKKIKAKLYLANILDIAWVSIALKNLDNFIDLTHGLPINGNTIDFIDLGIDNRHPGPGQHRQYADKLYNFIREGN